MAAIPANFGTGGSGLTPGGTNTVNAAVILRDIADDLAELHTQFIALLTKLDTEGGLGGGYVSGLTPADLLTTKA